MVARQDGIKQGSDDLITCTTNLNQNANINVWKYIRNSAFGYKNRLGDFFELQRYMLLYTEDFKAAGQYFLMI